MNAPATEPAEPIQNGVPVPEASSEPKLNGLLKPLDDPTTPVSDAVASEPKIDIDLPEQESDARHEPLPIDVEPGKLLILSTVFSTHVAHPYPFQIQTQFTRQTA
jgi:hypothetical protein